MGCSCKKEKQEELLSTNWRHIRFNRFLLFDKEGKIIESLHRRQPSTFTSAGETPDQWFMDLSEEDKAAGHTLMQVFEPLVGTDRALRVHRYRVRRGGYMLERAP